MSVTLTEKAASEVMKIITDQKLEDGTVLRVGVAGGGCSGFQYSLGFDTQFDPKADTKTDQHGVAGVGPLDQFGLRAKQALARAMHVAHAQDLDLRTHDRRVAGGDEAAAAARRRAAGACARRLGRDGADPGLGRHVAQHRDDLELVAVDWVGDEQVPRGHGGLCGDAP